MDEKFDVQKAIEWLNRHWQGPKLCPICNNNNWSVSDKPFELREFQGGSLVVGAGSIYPLIATTCNVCGYTLLFNAIVAGLVEAKQKETTPSPDTEQSEEERRRRL